MLIAVKLLCDLVQGSSPFRGPVSSSVKDEDWVRQSVKSFLFSESIVYTHSASSALEISRLNETGKAGQPGL